MSKEQYSPSTQAVSDAIDKVRWDWGNMCPADAYTTAAAALRALVKQNTKEYLVTEENLERHCEYQTYMEVVCVDDILTIIKELEETK
jgi:hypothetical protein